MVASAQPAHRPVLLEEVIAGLAIEPAGLYVDGTYGRGGHARAVLAQLGTEGRLVVVDRDPQAIESARQQHGEDPRVRILHAAFDRLGEVVAEGTAAGVLFDLGVSSPQLDDPTRGFSFMRDGPLDMRMDPSRGQNAADFVASAMESESSSTMPWTTNTSFWPMAT